MTASTQVTHHTRIAMIGAMFGAPAAKCVLGKYTEVGTVVPHKCTDCGVQFKASFNTVKNRSGIRCIKCERAYGLQQRALKAFREKYRDKYKRTAQMHGFVDTKTPCLFECEGCATEFGIAPVAVMRRKPKQLLLCRECDPKKSKAMKVKPAVKSLDVTLRDVKFKLRSDVERMAVETMLLVGIDPKAIKRGKPSEYKYGALKIAYRPAFRNKGSSYEVCTVDQMADEWKTLCAKRKANKKLRVLVEARGQIVILPKEFTNLSLDRARDYVEAKVGKDGIVMLSLDPGTVNHGWAVLKVNRPFKPEVLATGLIHNNIHDLKGNIQDRTALYLSEIQAIVEQFDVDSIAVERYMTRGLKGTTIECVNVMIGAIMGITWNTASQGPVRIMLMPASQWKNEWNRYSDLVTFYGKVKCVAHQVDSVGIGLYASAQYLGVKPFESIKKLEPALARQINKANIEVSK